MLFFYNYDDTWSYKTIYKRYCRVDLILAHKLVDYLGTYKCVASNSAGKIFRCVASQHIYYIASDILFSQGLWVRFLPHSFHTWFCRPR